MRRTASLKFYLKNPKKNGKLREVPVSIIYKFTAPGGRIEIPTGLWVQPRHWNKVTQEVKATEADHLQLNQKLRELKTEKLALFETCGQDLAAFERASRGTESPSVEKKTLAAALQLFLDQCKREKDTQTAENYRCAFLFIDRSLTFEQLDWTFFDRLKTKLYESGILDSTAARYVTDFKGFLEWATLREYPVHQSFRGWTMPKPLRTKLVLKLSELERLESAMLPTGPGIGRDFLCLEARTGARISDLLAFDVRDLHDNKWTYLRKKGRSLKAKWVTVPFVGFPAPALKILQKYKYRLPQFTKQQINRWIREACDIANINDLIRWETWKGRKCTVKEVEKWTKITSHVGRKTFITLGLQFMESPKMVKDIAGIDSWATIRHYEADGEPQFMERALVQMAEKIEQAKAG